MANDFILEIGTEEIPAKFMEPALQQIKQLAEKNLKEKRIDYNEINSYGTPRRLVLHITGLAEKQSDLEQEVKGPSKKAAYDEQGELTKAAIGFSKGQGVSVADLSIKSVDGIDYVFAVKKEIGGNTKDVMPEFCLSIIQGLNFPKPMRWGNKEMRFARPIRWIIALMGSEIIPFELEGLASGRFTQGHRFLSKGLLEVQDVEDYFNKLQKGYVIVKQEERKNEIWRQIQELAAKEGGIVKEDEELLEEVTYLLEYPTALCGTFSEDYLQLPPEVLITPMREHQRYFPVVDKSGKLLAKFITVRNGTADHIEIVQAGNEKVLRARLADAEFFYIEDLKQPLEKNIERLKKIVFQESLGTIFDKVERIRTLTNYLCEVLAVDTKTREGAQRAAYLAKADLVTNMVYEFPELQGIMGKEYAIKGGEGSEVAEGIFEHYLPRFAGDILPESTIGTMVSIADKMDTIVGCFAAGIQPTGSQDPYALRRQALGIAHIILEGNLNVSLDKLIDQAYQGYQGKINAKLNAEKTKKEVTDFFKQRIRNIFIDRGITYDVVDAILVSGFDSFTDTWKRAEALKGIREDETFNKLLTAFNRVNNLASKAEHDIIEENILVEEVEKQLFKKFKELVSNNRDKLSKGEYQDILKTIAQLQPAIDAFFDGVMVMAEDVKVKENRLALLKQISDYVISIADLSKIVA